MRCRGYAVEYSQAHTISECGAIDQMNTKLRGEKNIKKKKTKMQLKIINKKKSIIIN